MLYISKWKAAAILLTALICCLFAVPNFFPESMVKRWPAWAQRHIVLGLDLQGGSHILLEVDANDVRRQKLLALQDDVRRVLREARIGLTRAPLVRGNSVEVVIRESDLQQGLAKLRELSQPLGGFLGSTGARSLDVENAGCGVVRRQNPNSSTVRRRSARSPIFLTSASSCRARSSPMRSPASTSAPASRSSRSSSTPPALANSRRSPRRTSDGRLRSCSTTR